MTMMMESFLRVGVILIALTPCILPVAAEASSRDLWPVLRYEQQIFHGEFFHGRRLPNGTRLQFLNLGVQVRSAPVRVGMEFGWGRDAHPVRPRVNFLGRKSYLLGIGREFRQADLALQSGVSILLSNRERLPGSRPIAMFPALELPVRAASTWRISEQLGIGLALTGAVSSEHVRFGAGVELALGSVRL
jgi:hypothetical protein